MLLGLAVLTLSWAGFFAPVQDGGELQRVPESESRWIFAREALDLRLAMEICSEAFGVQVEYDPEVSLGTVWFTSPGGYTEEEIWAVLNRQLAADGKTIVQAPGSETLAVVGLEQAAGLARLESAVLDRLRAGFVKVLVPLNHLEARAVLPMIEPVLSKPVGKAVAAEAGNALVISDLLPYARQVLAVIDVIDRRDLEPTIEEFELDFASPTAIGVLMERVTSGRDLVTETPLRGTLLPMPEAKSVLVVAPPQEMAWWRGVIERFDRPEDVVTHEYTPQRFGLMETAGLIDEIVRVDRATESPGAWRMVTDELTGTLVVTTTPSRHQEIRRLMDRLEATDLAPRRPLRAFPIRHRQVSEVLGLLQELVDAGVLETKVESSGSEAVPDARGPTASIPGTGRRGRSGNTDSELTLAADEGANRILGFGPARMLDQVGSLIETLDVRGAQVLVETIVVSLTDAQTHDLGVELQHVGASGDALVSLGSLFGLGSPSPTSATLPAAGGTGFSGVVLDPGDYSAVVSALKTINEGRSLTTPKMLVNNNQEAVLESTLQTPYASTNASTTVATTSFGGTLDAGTTISVKPQVTDGDQLVVDYAVSLSTFTGDSSDPNLPPPRQETRLQSVVTIPDGYTVVVGGLEIETDSEAASRVPILGDIPLVQHLFQSRSRSGNRSRFFVFLRCSVTRSLSYQDLKYVSDRDVAAAGIDDGWPTLEPRVIR